MRGRDVLLYGRPRVHRGLSLRELLTAEFAGGTVAVAEYGNVLSSIGFLTGLATGELRASQLDVRDELYPLVVCACATKAP